MQPRFRFLLVPLIGLAALGAVPGIQAQVAPPARTAPRATVPADLEAVYDRARPATVRIETQPAGVGSGFVISGDGLVATAAHVVLGADSFRVVTTAGERLPGTIVGYDEARDLALVRVRPSRTLPALSFAPSTPRAGDAVLAIGNSRGAFLGARPGRVTALDRSLSASFPSGLIASTMPLAPGDSGGPVLNTSGQVAGVAVAVGRDRTGYSSFAAPLTAGSPVLAELRSGVKRAVPFLGVGVVALTPDVVDEIGYGAPGGLLVQSVQPNSGAARAGLREPQTRAAGGGTRGRAQVTAADVITAVDGRRVSSRDALVGYLRTKKVGDAVELTVRRDGRELRLRATLGSRAGS